MKDTVNFILLWDGYFCILINKRLILGHNLLGKVGFFQILLLGFIRQAQRASQIALVVKKQTNKQTCKRPGFHPWVMRIPWRRKWLPTPILLPGEFHGQRNPSGYSPQGQKSQTQLSDLACMHVGRASISRSGVICSVVSDSATPWTVACQAPLSMEFSRQEYWSVLPFLSPGDIPNPKIQTGPPT